MSHEGHGFHGFLAGGGAEGIRRLKGLVELI